MPIQLSIPFGISPGCGPEYRKSIPTLEDICLMCHYSSGCGGCCSKCKDKCNSSQTCGLKEDPSNHIDRMKAWIHIVDIDAMSHLKKYGVLTPLG
jgi:hypothetical protein